MGPKGRGFNGGRRILIVGGDGYGLKKVGLLLNASQQHCHWFTLLS